MYLKKELFLIFIDLVRAIDIDSEMLSSASFYKKNPLTVFEQRQMLCSHHKKVRTNNAIM